MAHNDVERRVAVWLKADAQPLPADVLAAVDEAVPRLKQLGRRRYPVISIRGPWWFPLAAGATAAAILVVVAGPAMLGTLWSMLPGPNGVGPTVVSPSPSPSPEPSPSAQPSPSSATAGDPFIGTWATLDVDGSPMTITFRGSGTARTVEVVDFRSTVCAGDRDVTTGEGSIEGVSIRVIGHGGCVGRPADQALDLTWTYDPATAVLRTPAYWTDGRGTLLWTRGPAGPDAFSGRWTAIANDGGSMTLSLDGTGLTRVVTFVHEAAAECLPGIAFSGQGTGTIGSVTGDGLYIRISLGGSCAGTTSRTTSVEKYRYDYSTNTLVGPLAPLEIGGDQLPQTVVWHRG